ncbi:RHS repeat-associated core domain protein [Bacteroidales bacterium Barb6XT]|nr:RHS repeat-associated core domain protein [Bacteroidales bacterium Barb6XT]
MNARLYDPLIGRFFSPDPKMMDGETQALNRFSYAMNNPFAYTDPSGEFIVSLSTVIVGAVIGAVVAGVVTAVTLAKSGASAGDMAWKIPVAMLIGGAAGAAGSYIGGAMYAAGGVAAALSGMASVAAASLIGSTSSFLTGANTLSVGLLSYNFNKGGLENPFGSVTQSIFSSLAIAAAVIPMAMTVTRGIRSLPSYMRTAKEAEQIAVTDSYTAIGRDGRPFAPDTHEELWSGRDIIYPETREVALTREDLKVPIMWADDTMSSMMDRVEAANVTYLIIGNVPYERNFFKQVLAIYKYQMREKAITINQIHEVKSKIYQIMALGEDFDWLQIHTRAQLEDVHMFTYLSFFHPEFFQNP